MDRGRYLCFEGGHASGKSALSLEVNAELGRRNQRATHVTFPSDRSDVGNLIRSYLKGEAAIASPKALLYLYAADGHAVDPWMNEVLHFGAHVVADRHPVYSGRVYQLEHHPQWHIENVYATAELLVPDVLFVVDVPPEVAIERMQRREKYKAKIFETSDVEKMEVYRQRYLELAATAVDRRLARRCHVLDGTHPMGDLVADAISLAGPFY